MNIGVRVSMCPVERERERERERENGKRERECKDNLRRSSGVIVPASPVSLSGLGITCKAGRSQRACYEGWPWF